jgi:hypothetical protein
LQSDQAGLLLDVPAQRPSANCDHSLSDEKITKDQLLAAFRENSENGIVYPLLKIAYKMRLSRDIEHAEEFFKRLRSSLDHNKFENAKKAYSALVLLRSSDLYVKGGHGMRPELHIQYLEFMQSLKEKGFAAEGCPRLREIEQSIRDVVEQFQAGIEQKKLVPGLTNEID